MTRNSTAKTCWTIDLTFNVDEVAALERGARRWDSFAGTKTCLVRGTRPTVVNATWDPELIHNSWNGAHSLNLIRLRRTTTDIDQLERVFMHELGHAHGLEHITKPGIMFPVEGTSRDFTQEDLNECHRKSLCIHRDTLTAPEMHSKESGSSSEKADPTTYSTSTPTTKDTSGSTQAE